MPSTSVHLPAELLSAIDRIAAEAGISRNKLVVRACQHLVAQQDRQWPEGFFARERLTDEERALLRDGADEMLTAIHEARRSRAAPPF